MDPELGFPKVCPSCVRPGYQVVTSNGYQVVTSNAVKYYFCELFCIKWKGALFGGGMRSTECPLVVSYIAVI